MRKSKIRGTKRKLRIIERHLSDRSQHFPNDFYAGVYNFKLPANQQFIAALNQKGQKIVSNYLMECAMNLKKKKPSAAYKIAVLLFPENFWRSELIIFEDEAVYRDFFDRHKHGQVWREMKNQADSFVSIHWMQKMYEEVIDDDVQQQQTFICYIER
ncbi:DUF3916 domain-containing protein [Solibacillus sp. FSL K6-1523]|uniref:DUF3916 domain-containing protein n=1 Tax=Solibacillus sp. FSL K6-1523 TaxID=2921471 RepID=UPI0030FAACA7